MVRRAQGMHLTDEELARLEQMFASGQVRSDPSPLSCTDQTMDELIRAARMKEADRRARRSAAQTSPAAAPLPQTPKSSAAAYGQSGSGPDAPTAKDAGQDWNVPRTLEQLIGIRRALMRNEKPEL